MTPPSPVLDNPILDNPIWHALNTRHADLAISAGLAKRYRPQVATFAGLAEQSAGAYADLAQIVAPGEVVSLRDRTLLPDPPGWTIHQRFTAVQMVCATPVTITAPESAELIVTLGAADLPDMLYLVDVTAPGPFFPGTLEMGRYIGIRQAGELIAMAGERLYVPGFREISAVCTHPEHQGKGYARLLIRQLCAESWARGDVPFLHVLSDNSRAQRLYEQLDFRVRVELPGIVISR